MLRKSLAVAVILLFIGMCAVPSTAVKELREKPSPVGFDGNTLYVGGSGPNNYTTIQSAINDSEDGDTVFVYDDSSPYYESLIINKTINLIGEDRDTTVIEKLDGLDGIAIYSDNVTVTDFTIKGFKYGIAAGIHIYSANNNSFVNNILTNNSCGIRTRSSHNTIISNNIIYANGGGILQENGCDFNSIFQNHIYENGARGIAHGGEYNNISSNIITNNGYCGIHSGGSYNTYNNNTISYHDGAGLDLEYFCSQNLVTYNKLSQNEEGLVIQDECNNNLILGNTIMDNDYGIEFINNYDSEIKNNTIQDNYFLRNNKNKITKNNNFIGNSLIIDGVFIEPNCIVHNNTVNGKPLIYLDGKSDIILDEFVEAGEILLVNCHNISIKNQDISNTYHGIILFNSNNCQIKNTTLASNNEVGIFLEDSHENCITGNIILENNEYGLVLVDSDSNEISGNIIKNHDNDNDLLFSFSGIELLGSDNNIITGNNITGNIIGMQILFSSNNMIVSNNFYDNRRSATFAHSYFNRWDGNYWDRPRMLPKPIIGTYIFFFPLIKFDWRPASEPYDIGV